MNKIYLIAIITMLSILMFYAGFTYGIIADYYEDNLIIRADQVNIK